ncbi:bifunctional von Willebrand factor A-like domain superfamily/ADF-H-Gelsolin-like domain superfamily/Sec23-Sec24 [Babesia duncani]|uniref:Bifunctional von Willebrand factor A-like domain superfamily/ADF-H-Gelsolin-like domain superfamily/Sec23-Sec24 n=1 Tax=Babesia duncani TaxID=323732 RepID=A0AAD9PLK6_9APIC|nr:bifunctional von Willebrand factor A-like domain superfamily/ADF-H-Gelsolin-like domain superfamily/Sec23-Sec24 [Babesia duncani]
MASNRPYQSPFQSKAPAKDPFGGSGHFAQQNQTTAPPPNPAAPFGQMPPPPVASPFGEVAPSRTQPPVMAMETAPPAPPPGRPGPPVAPVQSHVGALEAAGKTDKAHPISSLNMHVFHDDLTSGVAPVIGNGLQEKKLDLDMENIKAMNALSPYIRTSVKVLPSSQTLQQKTHIPLGFTIRPMAPLKEGDQEVPVVNHGTEPISRCAKCRTYINPFVIFESNRRNWQCNLCGASNETPSRYMNASLDPYNTSVNTEFPELSTGVVEYVASADYMVRPPQPPTIMFVIDVSAAAVNSGMVEEVCKTITDLITSGSLPGGPRTLVGIVTYDTSVHFYQMQKGPENLQILIVSDLENLFLPLPGEIFLNVTESSADILHLLDVIPRTWKTNTVSGSCMGSALRAAHFAMKHIGGKMCIFSSSPSYFGDFSLNASATMQHKKGGPNLQPVEKCKDYANMICQTQVSVEMFICTPQSVNLPGMYHLATQTAGAVHYIPFKSHFGTKKLSSELKRVIIRSTGWEAVMRIRISKGWRITNWYGHCFVRGSDLMVLPNCHSDQTYTVTFDHEERAVSKRIAYFQAALLHTTSDGERRIRVATYALPVSDNFSEILASLDPEACVLTATHLAINAGLSKTLADARSLLQTMCMQISSTMSALTPPPESVGRLVMYIFGLLKSPAFSEGSVPVDFRMYHWLRLRILPIDDLVAYCYPRLVPVHTLENFAQIPASLNLTHANLRQDGIYLVENGETMIMWVGKDISTSNLNRFFNVPTFDMLNCELAKGHLQTSGGPLSQVLEALRLQRLPYMSLQIVKQGDEQELKFYSMLIEDKTPGMMMSLHEFVNTMTTRSPFSFKLPHN